MSEITRSRAAYLLVGMGVGSALGILFAPKSGQDTRKYLSERAGEGTRYAQRQVRDLRERTEDLVDRSRKVATQEMESISQAIQAGRDAYHQEMSHVV